MTTVRFQLRRDTAANWTSVNPTLGPGEPALETDTGKVKYGNGATAWNSLPYFVSDLGTALIAIKALTPAADRYVYFTSASAAALGTITAFGRSLLDDADAATARGTLGLGTIATQAASSVAITGGSATGLTALSIEQTSDSTSITYYGSTAPFGGNIAGRRARGTPGSPTQALSGDVLTGLYAYSYRSTGVWSNAIGSFRFTATEDQSGTGNGTQAEIATTAIGATSRSTRTTIDDAALVQNGIVRPSTDNARTLGSASFRWSTVYAGTGTINTSDQRLKKWRGGLTNAELRAGKRIIAELGFYQWKDAIKGKGEDGARLHFGVRAQRAFAVLEEEGLDWRRYAWCCYDEWGAIKAVRGANKEIFQPARRKGNRYGVRMDQLALFLIAVQEARLARLEALASVE